MGDTYYLVREKAVPEVLLKVLQVRRLIEERRMTVQQATEEVGISRSSFYKYQDDIYPFHDTAKGKTITLVLQVRDETGILSDILHVIAEFHGNILTIHQSIPLNGVASLTISVEIPQQGDVAGMLSKMEERPGVREIRILGRE